jgi:hypothetical protein
MSRASQLHGRQIIQRRLTMPIRKRWPNDDGRQDPAVDYSGCPIPGLDKIPSNKLPDDVKTVFFGGGWFPLAYYLWNRGYQDAHYVFVSPFYLSLRPVCIGEWKKIRRPLQKGIFLGT